jgi:hypothetical protein
MRMAAWLGSEENSLCASICYMLTCHGEKGSKCSCVSAYEGNNLIVTAPPS